LTFPNLKKIYYQRQKGWQHPLTTEEIGVSWANPYEEQLKHFCRVILGAETPRTSGEDGRKTLEITLAVHQSAQTGQPITVYGR